MSVETMHNIAAMTLTKKVAVLLFLLIASSLFAGKKLPLPDKILTSKTLYIDNQSGNADLGDKAFDELSKWGRFHIVFDRKTADLILLLSTQSYLGGYVTSAGSQTSTTTGNTVTTTSSSKTTNPTTSGITYITILDPQTGDNLWSDSREWGKYRSATRGIIKALKARVESAKGEKK